MDEQISYIIHGFNVRDGGAATIDTLRTYLGGHVVDLNYGWTGRVGVRLRRKER